MQLRAEQRTAHPFSSGSPNPRPHGHPWEHTPSPASLCPAPCRRSQAPPSAEPPSSSTSHTWAEAADDTFGGVKPTVGSRLFAQTHLRPLTASGAHRCLPTSYFYLIQPDKASPLVLEHHLMRFNSCCIPSQRSLCCCTLGPVQDLSKPVENSH